MLSGTETRQPRYLIALLLAGPVIWSVHFLAGYLFVEIACKSGLETELLGAPLIALVVVVATVVALALLAVAALASYRNWKGLKQARPGGRGERLATDEDRSRFMAFSGFLLAVLFLVTTLISGIPALVLNPCVWQ